MQYFKRLKAVLFDLDGTLADTAPDLACALNSLLNHYKRPTLPFEIIRPIVGEGGKGLIRLGFTISDTDPSFSTLCQELVAFYNQDICTHTQLFPGIDALLKYLHDQHILWGIVTNKPALLTQALLEKLTLHHPPACIVSGDTVAKAKPHPEPLWHACELLKVTPADCLYVGDHERDIQAGKKAGMRTLAVSYGYIPATENPASWGADAIATSPDEILAHLQLK